MSEREEGGVRVINGMLVVEGEHTVAETLQGGARSDTGRRC